MALFPCKSSSSAKVTIFQSLLAPNATTGILSNGFVRSALVGNVGHFLFDEVFASFVVAWFWGEVRAPSKGTQNEEEEEPSRLQLVRTRLCSDLFWKKRFFPPGYHSSADLKMISNCERFHQEWVPQLLGLPMIDAKKRRSLWFPSLMVGISATNVHEFAHAGTLWTTFRHGVLHRLGVHDRSLPPRSVAGINGTAPRIVVTVLFKGRREERHQNHWQLHARQLLNMEEIVKTLHSFGDSVKVRVSSPSELSLKQHVAEVVETDVLTSPCGGLSMLAGFLPPGAAPLFAFL